MILKFLLFPILKYDLGRKITISLNYSKLPRDGAPYQASMWSNKELYEYYI